MSSTSLYAFLGVEKEASVRSIKTAYRRLALRVHPDRNDDRNAAEAFAKLQKVYETLVDPERRKVYDATGLMMEEEEMDEAEWTRTFRRWFASVREEDVVEYERKYRYGVDEEEDLKEFYERFEGEVGKVLAYVPYSEEEDVVRFVRFWDQEVEKGGLKKTEKYERSRKRLLRKVKGVKPRRKEEGEVKERKGMEDLAATILARRSGREKQMDSFLDGLVDRYGSGKSKKRKER